MRHAEGKARVSVVQLTIDLQSDLLFGVLTLPSRNPLRQLTGAQVSPDITLFCFFNSWLEVYVVLLSSFVPLWLLFPTLGHVLCVFMYSYKVLRWCLLARVRYFSAYLGSCSAWLHGKPVPARDEMLHAHWRCVTNSSGQPRSLYLWHHDLWNMNGRIEMHNFLSFFKAARPSDATVIKCHGWEVN